MPRQDEIVQEFVERLTGEFLRRIERKTSWENDEVRDEFLQSLAVAAIATASDVFEAMSDALHRRKVFSASEK